jgi:hypothetical protein
MVAPGMATARIEQAVAGHPVPSSRHRRSRWNGSNDSLVVLGHEKLAELGPALEIDKGSDVWTAGVFDVGGPSRLASAIVLRSHTTRTATVRRLG